MKITYDPEVDALYIRLTDAPVQATTQRLSEEIAINGAPDGGVVGIEILDVSEYAPDIASTHQILVEQLSGISA